MRSILRPSSSSHALAATAPAQLPGSVSTPKSPTIQLVAAAIIGVIALGGLLKSMNRRPPTTASFEIGGTAVEITFHGEQQHEEVFGAGAQFALLPVDSTGRSEGLLYTRTPDWLVYDYRINDRVRRVLVAKKPIASLISWDAIARAGAALGDDSQPFVGSETYRQNATVTDRHGNVYRVRLLRCGRSTQAAFSEWNLLIGAVHAGDIDFTGSRFGWVRQPYSDAELGVGFKGFLSWCLEDWRRGTRERVARGYFHVSRFHAADSHLRSERLAWRPVLERVDEAAAGVDGRAIGAESSPDGRVVFRGRVSNERLLGRGVRLADVLRLREGLDIGWGAPDWLEFDYDGRRLFVAAVPLRHSLSWLAIAKLGAALGDSSIVIVHGRRYVQAATVTDVQGRRYRVRLLRCGRATMDHGSEWNRLIGGVHAGDGDFLAGRDNIYGWLSAPYSDEDLHIGTLAGSATWCMEMTRIDGRDHAVNRGYLTVSRFHFTESSFDGYGFGWRPVLEYIP